MIVWILLPKAIGPIVYNYSGYILLTSNMYLQCNFEILDLFSLGSSYTDLP